MRGPLLCRLAPALLVLAGAGGIQAETFLLRNVNVLPMDAPRILKNQDLLLRDGLIAAMASHGMLAPTEQATVVDGGGGYLMPGLSDMHAHVSGYAEDEASAVPNDTVSVAENQLLLYLATGVTLLRDTGGSEAHFAVREHLESGRWIGPTFYFTSPILEGEKSVWDSTTKVLNPSDVEPLITGFAERGYWGVKIYHTLSAEVFDAVMAAGDAHDLPVVGHVPFEVGIDAALRAGMLTIEHLRGYDFDGMAAADLFADGGRSRERFLSLVRMSDARTQELVDLTVAEGVWNVPTLAIARFLFDPASRAALAVHPRYAQVHPELQHAVENASALDEIFSADAKAAMKEVYPRSQMLIQRLHAAGGGILIGTDAVVPAWVPGFTPIDEMHAIASSGIDNYDVLRMATLDAARVLGIDAERGSVAVGKRASLILLNENPLEDLQALWSLRGVMHADQWLPISTIEERLELQASGFPAN